MSFSRPLRNATSRLTNSLRRASTNANPSHSNTPVHGGTQSTSSSSSAPSTHTTSPTLPPLPSSPLSPHSSSPLSSRSSTTSNNNSEGKLNRQYTIPTHNPIPRPPSYPTKYPNSPTHTHINFPHRIFSPPKPDQMPEVIGGNTLQKRETVLGAVTGLKAGEIRGLNRVTAVLKRPVQMTGKGKIRSYLAYVVVGSPERGLVGLGMGRGALAAIAVDKAFHQGVLQMDYVNKYENRTVWGQGREVSSTFGATKVLLRARPAGFGLMVPDTVHRILTACGIRDCSASIEGSKDAVMTMKCVLKILHGGGNPYGFGDGLCARGRRQDKGMGMRSQDEIERERGRYGVDIGRRV